MSQKEALIEATQKLLSEYGYESTSPKDIQRQSGAGQGSFYHHFGSKKELALAALQRTTDELLGTPVPPKGGLKSLLAFLKRKRSPLAGCRLGRHAQEYSIVNDPELRAPLKRYFTEMQKELAQAASEATTGGEIKGPGPEELSWLILAAVQGGYTLARVQGQGAPMHAALSALAGLLKDSGR